MKDLLVCIYMTNTGNGFRAFLTHNPDIDAGFLFGGQWAGSPCSCQQGHVGAPGAYYSLDLLTPFIPIGIAHYIFHHVFTPGEIYGYRSSEKLGGTCTGALAGTLLGEPVETFTVALAGKLAGWLNGRTGWLTGRLTGNGGNEGRGYEEVVRERSGQVKMLIARMEEALGKGMRVPVMDRYPVKYHGRVSDIGDLGARYPGEPVPGDIGQILGAVRGRVLFLEEISRSLRENNLSAEINPDRILDLLQVLALRGETEIMPSLGFTAPGELTCLRCGNRSHLNRTFLNSSGTADKINGAACPACGFPSFYCEQCSAFGESRLCRGLFAAGAAGEPGNGSSIGNSGIPHSNIALSVKIEPAGVPPLSPAQGRASAELADFVTKGDQVESLVWAVCGAGKTEVVFDAIAAVLNSGGRVLYAIPRRDVVRELAPRLQSAFRGVEVLAAFGGSPEKFRSAPVVIATTHQCIRFYRCFDLIVLDEVDAYPYKGSRMLHMAVRRAVKTGGKTIYLTATPDKKTLAKAKSGQGRLITIPARYHGHPVPEPRIMTVSAFNKNRAGRWTVEPIIMKLLENWLADEGRQVFIFLPTVRMVENFGPVLKESVENGLSGRTAGNDLLYYSHARDPLRDRKREGFKAGEFPFFLTTTIMERGITVKKANVLVLEADYEQVFDEGTLVQMAGRAGRSAEYPDGEVVFSGKRAGTAMKKAREQIMYLNRVAAKEGYLKGLWVGR